MVGDNVGGFVMAIVGDPVVTWALDLARRRSKAVDVITEAVMLIGQV